MIPASRPAATETTGRSSPPSSLRELWTTRPSIHARGVWALLLALDHLPWPWGEDIVAALFAAAALLRSSRRRPALAWGLHQGARSKWRLAVQVSAFRGRWVARSALLGIRRPEDFGERVRIEGEEHLAGAGSRGTILLGFHLGPPCSDVALRIAGHRLAWFGNVRHSRSWSRSPWRALLDPAQSLTPPDGQPRFWPGYLYRARRMLLDGGTILILADAWTGREFLRVVVPGGVARIMTGWVTLHRQTGARVLPVITHLEGRDQVITIHPPLPEPAPADVEDLQEWRQILTGLVREYARRWPDQCPVLAFGAYASADSSADAGVPSFQGRATG